MKTVIVDDHPLVRRGLSTLFALGGGAESVMEASSVAEAVGLIVQTRPELVVVDLKLGKECGLDVIRQARERDASCSFLVLTSSASAHDFRQAELLGVAGYVLKEALPEELLYAVSLVAKGRKYYDPTILDMLAEEDRDDPIGELTPRECEVLKALAEGMKNFEIAQKLFITEYTVKKHVSQILDKLSLRDRTQAALYARERALLGRG